MRISERAEQKKKYFISAHPILVPVSLFGLAFYFGLNKPWISNRVGDWADMISLMQNHMIISPWGGPKTSYLNISLWAGCLDLYTSLRCFLAFSNVQN